MSYMQFPGGKLPLRSYDVCIVGAGTGGVIAAIAAARQGAKTVLIEAKGYVGGTVVEGGTALHSFYNNFTFYKKPKTKLVEGIPQELVDRLQVRGATYGHVPMSSDCRQDSYCTSVDTELYKLIAQEFLIEEGVTLLLETRLTGALVEDGTVKAVRCVTHGGEIAIAADAFIDCTGYGDLCAMAGASYDEPNDYGVNSSIGLGGVSVPRYYQYILDEDALRDVAMADRPDGTKQIVRLDGLREKLPQEFILKAAEVGLKTTVTCIRDDYFMFVKIEYKPQKPLTDVDEATFSAMELRRRQEKSVALLREYVPGCENAFIARTSPAVCIRRARAVRCDKELVDVEVTSGARFDNEIGVFGYHDEAPRRSVNEGGCFGLPYDMLLPKGIENLFAAGMMITPDHHAHMATRNTVCCMVQAQGAGVAAALISAKGIGSRQLEYPVLRAALDKQNVCFARID